jgi:hypothetical protein
VGDRPARGSETIEIFSDLPPRRTLDTMDIQDVLRPRPTIATRGSLEFD